MWVLLPVNADKEIKTPNQRLTNIRCSRNRKTEDLQSLQGTPYIKVAVRGVTVEKY